MDVLYKHFTFDKNKKRKLENGLFMDRFFSNYKQRKNRSTSRAAFFQLVILQ